MLRRIAAFLAAVVAAYALGAIASTQIVLNSVAALGMPVDLATRGAAVLHDLPSMAPVYGPLVAIAFLIALPGAALVMRFVPGPRTLGYVLAGAAALLVVHLAIPAVLGLHMLPATRSLGGLMSQVAAGAAGGYVFGVLRTGRGGVGPDESATGPEAAT